jgi:hypothetical protein
MAPDLTFIVLWAQVRNPDILSFYLKKSRQATPSRFSNGAPMEMPISIAFLYLSSRVHSKGALSPGSLHRAPIERDAPPPELLSAISQSPR